MAVCNSQRECYKQALNIQNMAKDDSLYSPNLFPLTGTSQILNVTVAVIIYKLMSLTNDKSLTLAMEVDLIWLDPNFPGNWSKLPNNTQLYVDSSQVWTINLYIINPASSNLYLKPNSLVYLFPPPVNSSGAIVQGSTIDEFSSVCDTMNLSDFPFDTQTCSMVLEYGDSVNIQNINFLLPATLIMSNDVSNPDWHVTNVTVGKSPNVLEGESFYGISVNFTFVRKSYYYVLFIIVPIVILQSVGLLTVVLPSDGGEKVVLGSTLVVAMYVLITTLNQMVPQVEQNEVPRVVFALQVGVILNAVTVFEAVGIKTLRVVAHEFPSWVHHMLDISRWFRSCSGAHGDEACHDGQHSHSESSAHSTTTTSAGSHDSASSSNVEFTVISGNMYGDFGAEEPIKGPQEPQTISLLPAGPAEDSLVQQMLQDMRERRESKRIKRIWRNVEFALNFLTFLVYVILLAYFFGDYIYIVP